ncbi:MAG: hypothetical protein CMN32_13590 [Saprospirales bacterium]|nr:hypothetical protein [Saprospirales bacterium]
MNNKVLLLVLVALLAVYGVYELASGNESRTFDPEITKFEKGAVTELRFRSKADSLGPFALKKEGERWTVSRGDHSLPASNDAVDEVLNNLLALRAAYIAAKSSDKWPEYELTEEQATSVQAFAGGKKVADVRIGKFSANPQTQQLKFFVRTGEGDNVYAVEGMAGILLNKSFDDFRDKSALDFDLHNVDELIYGGESQYTVSKTANGWKLDGTEDLDSTRVQNFLMNLHRMSGDEFADGFESKASQLSPFRTLTIRGAGLPEDIVVKCWQDTTREKPFVIQTSQFPESYFASDTLRLYKRIFKPVSEW